MSGSQSKRNTQGPKSYRIYQSYKVLFESCIDVFGKRTALADALINRLFSSNQIEDVPTYTKAILVEKMIDDIRTKEIPYDELKKEVNSERMQLIKDRIRENNMDPGGVREYIHFRILPGYRDFIQDYSVDTLGEVIELAIANFVNGCTEFEFELIEISFSYNLKKMKK